jgi:NADPH:quinone reductase-like Zn-dependent oxidoreductase
MRAVILENKNVSLADGHIADIAIPKVQLPTDVLLKVTYASINPVDYKLAAKHPTFWQYPYVLGLDVAGEVIAIGSECTRFEIGDRVAIHGNLSYGGALAEYVVHPEHALYKIPLAVTDQLAVAAACAGLTSYSALVRKMNIQANRTIFIQGGSGGVGNFAIIIAKSLGLHVVSSCSTANVDYVKTLGADIVIDYKTHDVYAQIKGLFPSGVDYVLETSTKDNLQRDLSILAFNGHIASIVGILATQAIHEFATGFSFHEVVLGGAYLSGHYLSQCDLAQMGHELMQLLVDNNAVIKITEYSLEEFKQAFATLQGNKNSGKIVIKI